MDPHAPLIDRGVTTAPPPMLDVRDLWAQPPGAHDPALRGVTFSLGRGEWLAITGANGSGKTTLALAAAGLWPMSRGRIEVDGVPLRPSAAGRAAAGVATVLQEPASQLFERRVDDEIAFAARNLGQGGMALDERVRRWSAAFGLDGVLDRDPHELSAGWQQRVLLAAALATEPKLLVADEPAAHLDAGSRRDVLALVRREVAAGLAVAWVTQDATEARAADRVMNLAGPGILSRPREVPAAGGVTVAPHASSGRIRVRIAPPGMPAGTGARIAIAHALDLELAAGRPVALMGPNGAGKSVALEAIAGVRACTQVEVEREPAAGSRGPILAAQYPELQVFGETVEEELKFGSLGRGGDPAAALAMAAELLTELELERAILRRSTWDLSSGERRVVQIVAALVTPASAFLVDEPTCGLDPRRSERVAGVLRRWGGRVPLVVATQDIELATRMGGLEVLLGQ